MKHLYLFLALVFISHMSFSQLRMAITGGPHSSAVKEQNAIPSWETDIKPGYSKRPGLHLGILVDVPLSSNNRLFFQPGIMYMEKGRKYYMRNDTATSIITDTISSSYNMGINYIEMPLNLTYKIPLGKKAKFFAGAGPYIGFFYNGKQKNETRIYSSNTFKDEEVRLESGKETGKFKTIDAGLNARIGFELGNVILSGFMSEGLTNFYTASYDGTFRHQVRGVSLGIWLNKVKQPAKPAKVVKVADKPAMAPVVVPPVAPTVPPVPDTDKDGLNDQEDKCPNDAGIAANGGCPEVKRDTIVKVIEEKISFVARNIFFEAASDRLTASSFAPLDEVVKLLTAHPTLKLQIDGHTDSSGIAEKNLILSKLRAEAVKNYLTSKGIDGARLIAEGFGSAKPLQSNETFEGRKRNRRVELKLAQ
jgi:outer membrane protein OmpA-like peptidoglycan-associated protein